ncbi:hypothetical protein [Halobellus rarus]|uniref:Uncharacterized protein n=1 Tax=Halobellus rarus TaxID=1126237 RepID=A0ABD6CMX1_9EURY|nr:hypothetical protein [Halobellus rarus]
MADGDPDAGEFVDDDDGIQIGKLGGTVFLGAIFAIASVISRFVQLPFEFASTIYGLLGGGIETFSGAAFDAEAWGVGTAWSEVATSLSGEWGVLSFAVALAIVAGWFALVAAIILAAREAIGSG